MPTYADLEAETWWTLEYEPPPLQRFNQLLRDHSGLTRSECGSKGDNQHLRGRHRSRNWDLNSRYCTDRSYGTSNPRDRNGPGNALRATDYGLSGPAHWATCRRVDTAVRAGRLPELAEWYGTFDGKTVVGWSNGRPATSDSSHLKHVHFGYWTDSVENYGFFDRFYMIVTGEDMALDTVHTNADGQKRTTEQMIVDLFDHIYSSAYATSFPKSLGAGVAALVARPPATVQLSEADRDAIAAKVAALMPTVEQIARAVADEDHRRSEQ